MTLALPRTTMARLTGALRGDLRTADTATPTPQNPESLLDFSNDLATIVDLQQRLDVYCSLMMAGCRSADPDNRRRALERHEDTFYARLTQAIEQRYQYGYIVFDENGLSLYENDSTRARRTPHLRMHSFTFSHGCYRAATKMLTALTGSPFPPEMCSDKKVSFMEAHWDREHGWTIKLGIRRP